MQPPSKTFSDVLHKVRISKPVKKAELLMTIRYSKDYREYVDAKRKEQKKIMDAKKKAWKKSVDTFEAMLKNGTLED